MIRGLPAAVGLAFIVWTMPAQAALKHAAPDFSGDRVIELCADPGWETDSFGSGDDVLFKGCSTPRTKQLDIEGAECRRHRRHLRHGCRRDSPTGAASHSPAPAAPAPASAGHPLPPAVGIRRRAHRRRRHCVRADRSVEPSAVRRHPGAEPDVLNGIVETFKNQAKLWEKHCYRPAACSSRWRSSNWSG